MISSHSVFRASGHANSCLDGDRKIDKANPESERITLESFLTEGSVEKNRIPYAGAADRVRIVWPNNARIAFYVGINIEYYDIDRPNPRTPDAHRPEMLQHVYHEYGARVGVFRMMEILDRHNMRASVLLNSEVCDRQPEIIAEGVKRKWEWLGPGITNQRSIPSYPPEEEQSVIRQVRQTITAATGVAPKGWLGPGLAETFQTPDLLAAEGFEYVCDWGCDDQPLPMQVSSGRLLSVPYQQGLNDATYLRDYQHTGNEYARAICDAFDVLYEEAATGGKVLALPTHPHNTGVPMNAKSFSRALDYITSHRDVWLTTAGEIADWYYASYYYQPSSKGAVTA
jgi:peptidoglycan/xylan/chitin deacetylase (PgdA/CDA1 family)